MRYIAAIQENLDLNKDAKPALGGDLHVITTKFQEKYCFESALYRCITPRISWVARPHTFIKLTINDLEVTVSYLFCNTMPRESQINGGSSQVVIRMFHTNDPLLFLSIPSI